MFITFKSKPMPTPAEFDLTVNQELDSTSTDHGTGFNIVRMVQEHAPVRIQEIDKEISKMETKIAELSAERCKLESLLAAISK